MNVSSIYNIQDMECKYSIYGCQVTCFAKETLSVHEHNLDFHMAMMYRRLSDAQAQCAELADKNEYLQQQLQLAGIRASKIPKKRINCLPVHMPDHTSSWSYPLEMKLLDNVYHFFTIDKVTTYGTELPEYLRDVDAASMDFMTKLMPLSIPELLVGRGSTNSLLLIQISLDKSIESDTVKSMLYRIHVSLMSDESKMIDNSHFLLSDCMQFPSLYDVFQAGNLIHTGMYAFLGLYVDMSLNRVSVAIRPRNDRKLWGAFDKARICVAFSDEKYSTIQSMEVSEVVSFQIAAYTKAEDVHSRMRGLVTSRETPCIEQVKYDKKINNIVE